MEINPNAIDIGKYLSRYYGQFDYVPWETEAAELTNRYNDEIANIDNDSDLSEQEKVLKRELITTWHNEEINQANNKKRYWIPPTPQQQHIIKSTVEAYCNMKINVYKVDLDIMPLPKEHIVKKHWDYITADLAQCSEALTEIMNGRVMQDFHKMAQCAGYIKALQYLNDELATEIAQPDQSRIKWIGKPAQLGYIMGLLADNGYIDAPRKDNGEISYIGYARLLAKAFDYKGQNIDTLAKALNVDECKMEADNIDKIQIPHIKDIS